MALHPTVRVARWMLNQVQHDATRQQSSIRRLIKPLWALAKNLAAILGNADAVFKLRGQAPVARYRRPAIVEHFACGLADVDHRFNREDHAGPQLWTRAGAADMDDFGGIVE